MKNKKIAFITGVSSFLVLLLIIVSNYSIEKASKNKTFFDAKITPKNKVGLVLGTSKYLKNGRINLYFKYRIDATAELYNNGKIEYVLVSGDNGSEYYNEPTDFKNELIERGIPEENIYLDYAGFRTLDSVVRAQKVFGQESFTVISQKFHNERAIYLAQKSGLNVVGFNAEDIEGRYGLKVKLREYLARTKAFLDIIFNTEPKFYGDKVLIE